MIVGVGVDLVQIDRMRAVMERFPQRFPKRILHPDENAGLESARSAVHFMAQAFATKEAASKALGYGFRGLAPSDFALGKNARGKPLLTLSDRARATIEHPGKVNAQVSLSDEAGLVVAFVVIEVAASTEA